MPSLAIASTVIALWAGSALSPGPRSPSPVPVVTAIPARPVRGSLIRLIVTDTAAAERPWSWIDGAAGGEPLHFRADGNGRYSALAGIPLEGPDSLGVTLRVTFGDGTQDSCSLAIFVLQPEYIMERLHVSPKMAAPDSAAQARIAVEQSRAREVGHQAHDTPKLWTEPFLPPRDSRITSSFGTGREFNRKVVSRHLGTDFAGANGDPVRASNRGVVALLADFYLAGKVIYVDHGEGLISAYFHLSSASVAQGDTVERGQVIGAVGASGRVTGPHLHWVTRYGGVTVDPASVLRLLGEEGEQD
jgi:murein DD-endopeptidase MepM/ murein hydrolase activator NlpD